jgi:hypothetical protein
MGENRVDVDRRVEPQRGLRAALAGGEIRHIRRWFCGESGRKIARQRIIAPYAIARGRRWTPKCCFEEQRGGDDLMRALSLSDYQLQQVKAAAANLLPSQRTNFLKGLPADLAINRQTKRCNMPSPRNWQ